MIYSQSHPLQPQGRFRFKRVTWAVPASTALVAGVMIGAILAFLAQGQSVDRALIDWHGNVAASTPVR